MNDSIQSIIDQLGVVVIVGKLDNPGYYNTIWNAIFINQDLDETEHKVVLLHELGHACKQHDDMALYNATMYMKAKMEYGANRFMIKYLFKNYIDLTGDEPHSVNYINFMRQNDIPTKDEDMVREIIANYKLDSYRM